MAVKTKKKITAVAKKKKPAATRKAAKTKKGSKLSCNVCGMVVTVDEVCGCVEEHALICCSTPMKPKKR